MDEKSLKKLLLKENEEFRKLFEQHKMCDKELEKLQKKRFLTDEDRIHIKELKKKKLAYKDKLYFILSEHKDSFS